MIKLRRIKSDELFAIMLAMLMIILTGGVEISIASGAILKKITHNNVFF